MNVVDGDEKKSVGDLPYRNKEQLMATCFGYGWNLWLASSFVSLTFSLAAWLSCCCYCCWSGCRHLLCSANIFSSLIWCGLSSPSHTSHTPTTPPQWLAAILLVYSSPPPRSLEKWLLYQQERDFFTNRRRVSPPRYAICRKECCTTMDRAWQGRAGSRSSSSNNDNGWINTRICSR